MNRIKLEWAREHLRRHLEELELGDLLFAPPYTYRLRDVPITLTLPLPPNPNSSELRGRHWTVRRSKKAGYFADCQVAMIEQGVKFPREPWERAQVDTYFLVHNLLDEDDNLPARRKWILDFLSCETITGGLSKAGTRYAPGTGFFRDDSPRNLERGELRQAIDRRKPRVELTLRRIK